jgi:tRNA uridine 5-carboxymethylaminomethyl modification enzyme
MAETVGQAGRPAEGATLPIKNYDVIVVGAGHAGCEAALAAARMGCSTLLVTMNLDSIALMPCNPSMGGPAKGHLIREIDALGGEIGRNTDRTFIQIRMLNTGKGPAVQALRAQCDKQMYRLSMKTVLEEQPNLEMKQAQITRLLSETGPDGRPVVLGVVTGQGWEYRARAIILTTGTFINGRLVVGEKTQPGGRAGEGPALGISDSLRQLGLTINRLKTGTPPRIDARTIDFNKTEIQQGSATPLYFSADRSPRENLYLPPGRPSPLYPVPAEVQTEWRPQLPCYLVHTTPETHAVIRANLHRSPLYSGIIEGIGPRYCPSIEDKVVRFSHKETHQVFLEPEGWRTGEVYVQGMNTSLPEDVQLVMLRTIPALEHVEMVRVGYAVEYDAVPSDQITPSLETKAVDRLFLAGQINGTSGYEEAAAQGIIAGINAALKARGQAPFILTRQEAYIGVLLDDLVTQPMKEPYRLHTSRAEHRLLLRQDNADLRLSHYGRALGLLDDARWEAVERKRAHIAEALGTLDEIVFTSSQAMEARAHEVGLAPLGQRLTARELLRRPETRYWQILKLDVRLPEIAEEAITEVELQIKYEGYIRQQERSVERVRRLEEMILPDDADYAMIPNLRTEAREKLARVRPYTLGQAARVGGVTSADIAVLLVYLERHRRQNSALPA